MNLNILDEIIKRTPAKKRARKGAKIDENIIVDNYGLHRNNNRNLVPYHSVIMYCLILISTFFLLAGAFSIQVIKNNSLAFLADRNMVREIRIQPERGVI